MVYSVHIYNDTGSTNCIQNIAMKEDTAKEITFNDSINLSNLVNGIFEYLIQIVL